MSRLRLPAFIHEVIDDPHQRGILTAGCLALFAVGLFPRVLSPGLPNAQEALRTQPEIQNLFLLLAFASTATIILGGVVSDIFRHRVLLVGALLIMLLGSLISIVFDDGGPYYLANFVAIAAAGVVLAYGVGSVAIAYEGIPRATALGFIYGAFGAGTAASPAVLTIFPELQPSGEPGVPSTFSFDTTLAYTLSAIAAGMALWAAYRWVPKIPGTLPASRSLIISVAVWSLAVLALASGVLGLGGEAEEGFPIALILFGIGGVAVASLRFRRTSEEMAKLRLDRRGIGAALAVGMAIGFAQAVPLMLLPVVFEYPLRYGTLFAIFAIAPFAIALFLAGPVSGVLLRRFGPRGMMTFGTLAVGVANVLLALLLVAITGFVREFYRVNPEDSEVVLDPAHYLLFIIPLAFVGAGFVLATTVRTAIVFAGTPRGLPASAAAINEASVGLGSRIGIVAATTALAAAAVGSANDMFRRGAPEEAATLAAEFELTLTSLGTPRFREVYAATLEGADPIKGAAYSVAYMDGVTVALILSGVVGVLGALLAWLLIGRRDPLQTVFDMREERAAGAAPDQSDGEPEVISGSSS